ncbi:hypothetical protein MPSEU_000284600 [Mayamaea pseudoterrestris]|nr:hypothetical protein MPSEU_000284600 [Mayamaea pseudoterrestris]
MMSEHLTLQNEEHKEDDLSSETARFASFSPETSAAAGPTLIGSPACPCCNQRFDRQHQQTMNEPTICMATSHPASSGINAPKSFNEMHQEEQDALPGVLDQGLQYTPVRILAEGWLHKKGTGNDWLSSRGWKTRWARLCLARVDGFETEVPLLLIYWFPISEDPSTIIVLDHTVVIKLDKEDQSQWNSFRFEVRHVSKEGRKTMVTRTFAAPRKGRDAWVYAISNALLYYEKKKDQVRKQAIRATSPFQVERSRSLSPIMNDLWLGDRMRTSLATPGCKSLFVY